LLRINKLPGHIWRAPVCFPRLPSSWLKFFFDQKIALKKHNHESWKVDFRKKFYAFSVFLVEDMSLCLFVWWWNEIRKVFIVFSNLSSFSLLQNWIGIRPKDELEAATTEKDVSSSFSFERIHIHSHSHSHSQSHSCDNIDSFGSLHFIPSFSLSI